MHKMVRLVRELSRFLIFHFAFSGYKACY